MIGLTNTKGICLKNRGIGLTTTKGVSSKKEVGRPTSGFITLKGVKACRFLFKEWLLLTITCGPGAARKLHLNINHDSIDHIIFVFASQIARIKSTRTNKKVRL